MSNQISQAPSRTAKKLKSGGRVAAPKLKAVRYQLNCGATLLVDERPGAPVTAIKLHLKGGHSLDKPGFEGTASLTGRLLDQGTKSHSEEEIAALLEPSGGGVQGDANGVSGSIAGGDWKLLVGVICEVVCEPDFPKDKFARHKERLLDRLLVERDDHRSQSGKLFRKLIYGDHWMGRTAYGTLESVEQIQRKQLVAYHAKNWCPTRAVIAVCGDVDPEAVRKLFNRKLSSWKPKAKLSRPNLSFPNRSPRFDAFFANRQQVHVYFGHLGVSRNDPNYTALVVMDHILGTGPGFSNRISQKLRDQMGLAYTVHADIHSSAGVFPGMFTAYIGTSPQHLELALRGFVDEMNRICEELVQDSELELARNYLLGSYALGFERAARRTNYMISAERFGLPADHLQSLPDKFAVVSAEDIREAARACLFPDQSSLVVGGPIQKNEVKALFTKLHKSAPRRRK